ncbi:AP-3 complex subunit beta NDAI_0B00850 [Naumovozyma dairenensis CBS 421]|uniref:Clathrin/coatomer adaptor adaptin-like N-terminal domain-containing protein n=1 Tax=Naumovozyma dairenensis (strain ATCC 10597 / BCRC 20456 / CBS 421 / NBRC 0211 / NRRL Y-12639) TaxID=1071378 RepID=G0W5Q8_NAUDC|nr:hypothetical protein NDAI_0B00850 [Naumovozyma dairenensis CBS 421]CCD23119.1 hypothetical protein NDAI_0B00850 [Naumovozyma dairenensis CBS 421]
MVDSVNPIASVLESARTITMDAAAVASSKLGESSYTQYSKKITPKQLRTMLNSRNTRDLKDAMKRIISLMASDDTSTDLSSYFADVVKNITSNDIKIKRLICIYLLRFAEREPNLTLLSVNSLQKTISDTNPEVRCFAIRSLSDMKIASLNPMILYTLKTSVTDPSALVRYEVAFALLKLFKNDEEEGEFREEISNLLKDLLADADPRVISGAVILLKECFPSNLELLHGHFRRYCRVLKEIDSWAQGPLIDLLAKYCKQYLPRPMIIDCSSEEDGSAKQIPLPDNCSEIPFMAYNVSYDPDLSLFLDNLKTLIYSPNPIVILACCNAYFQLSVPSHMINSKFPDALVRSYLCSSNAGLKDTILQSIIYLSALEPTLFQSHLTQFFLSPINNNNIGISSLKLRILSNLVNATNVKGIVKELQHYIISFNSKKYSKIIIESSNALAKCGQLSTKLETYIMNWFIELMEDECTNLKPSVLDVIVNIIRQLVQNEPRRHLAVILKLSNVLNTQKTALADNARAGIIWLFGEIAGICFDICPDLLRQLIPNFVDEGVESRGQILLFAAKLLSYDIDKFKESHGLEVEYDFKNSRISQMFNAVLFFCKVDDEFDVRDRARCFESLFNSKKFEIASLLLQAPKPLPLYYSQMNGTRPGQNNVNLPSSIVGLDQEIQNYCKYIPWTYTASEDNNTAAEEGREDIRSESPVKDYSRYKKSFSSSSFISKSSSSSRAFASSNIHGITNGIDQLDLKKEGSDTITLNTVPFNKKYKLQSLDEFFQDIPEKPKPRLKKKIIIQEEEEEEEEAEEDDEEDSDESGTSSDDGVDDDDTDDTESSSDEDSSIDEELHP